MHGIQPRIALSEPQMTAIGNQIWHNECGKRVESLTTWNVGENFASLGIGHFIWYPAGVKNKKFNSSFIDLIAYLKKNNVTIPTWLSKAITTGCPWPTRDAFLAARNSKKMQELRTLLATTVDLQTKCIVSRFHAAIERISQSELAHTKHIRKQLNRLLHTSNGLYALIDYINFKGDGLRAAERYQNNGWGLLQVLSHMQGKSRDINAVKEFCAAAKVVLEKRVNNAPPESNEQRWLQGWLNRINSYISVTL
jgi:hypothetical protein